MKKNNLDNAKVAILALDGVEQSELMGPRDALMAAGADVKVISLKRGNIKAWQDGDWGINIPVDATLDEVTSEEFDALVLPGGTLNGDKLRQEQAAISFTREFIDSGKTVGAICHGVQILIEAKAVEGRTLTSALAIRTDMENAGANWVNQAAATDKGIVTSRMPSDIPAFVGKVKEEILEGRHKRRKAA